MVVEKAYAKINLGLEVVKKRDDSYHELAMVMTSISLADEIHLSNLETDEIILDAPIMDLEIEKNLVYKAAVLLKSQLNIKKGVKITLIKNIPERAGLGGGSADAAATLRGLNTLWNLNLSLDELARMAIELGSDVPFCIYNKTAKVTGRGEIIEFIADVPYFNLLLVIPQFTSSTAEVFNSFKIHNRNKGKIDKLIKAISTKDIDEISANLFNDLEYSYFFRDISKIKANLIKAGAKTALMSGSGSTVYAICLNEKDAVRVNHKFLQNNRSMKTIFVQTRSSIRYKWSGQARKQIRFKTIAETRVKATGFIPLVYQRIDNDYVTIETPVNIYNEIFVEKVNNKIAEVYLNDYLEVGKLSKYLQKIVDYLGYGLRIKISEGLYSGFNLINPENYLSAIIKSLENFDENIEKIYNLFSDKILAYSKEETFYYKSKTEEIEFLGNVPYGSILIADLGIKGYRNPRYTKQIEMAKEVKNMIEAIEERNFYGVADNLYNSLSRFEIRNIESRSSINVSKLRLDCFKFGSQGFVLSVDGRKIICIARSDKNLKVVRTILKNFHNLRKTLSTSFKSNITHQAVSSKVLIEIPKEKVMRKPDLLDSLEMFNKQAKEELDYDRYDYEDFSNPFGDEVAPFKEETKGSPKKSLSKQRSHHKDKDLEGILYIHSGGSLFKVYDFVDIAKYFKKYFHNKQMEFQIAGESHLVGFKIDNLPHLLGIHKIDVKDDELRGRAGFEKLVNGKIRYRDLQNKLDQRTFNQIIKRTQSSVLIFNDIYHGRDNEFICYDNETIFKEESKLRDKLKYGITRGVAGNEFHTRNVLGIGYEEESDTNYFVTSFLWDAQASLGKKEGYKVKIVKK